MLLERYPYINSLVEIQLKRLKLKTNIIIDVGAFDGQNCSLVARCIRNSITYAIEPYSRAHKKLVRVAKKVKNIRPHRLAITGSNGETTLHFIFDKTKKLSQSNSLYSEFIGSKNSRERTEEVETMTLDSFCSWQNIEQITFLKLNCEGSEYDIFEDKSSREIIKSTKLIYVALHGKSQRFISEEYQRKKQFINLFLKRNKFRLIYGEDVTKMKKDPLNHVNQIWLNVV
ncbi:MAG: FkbM family methyltransferase [Promethearchaeota archaeon]|jgi:FkbM family methyltransferase